MNDGKDTRSFFRKVVNFVVNPRGGDAADSISPDDEEVRDSEFAKSELKAMIERKRRNDFVRKRELDLLRKLRREGLTPEQLAALGSSSGMADTQTRSEEAEMSAHPDMKERIDEIEQQMSNHAPSLAARRDPQPTSNMPQRQATGMGLLERSMADTIIDSVQLDDPSPQMIAAPALPQPGARNTGQPRAVNPPNSGFDMPLTRSTGGQAAVEVTEVGHDPELDEAVISYANGDSATAETLLRALIGAGGSRRQHSDTWMVVFDLYRGTGQQAKFEALANEYAERFGQSAPHWFSVPKMVAEAAAHARPPAPPANMQVTWYCAADLDAAVVEGLRVRVQMAPLPWVLDWTALQRIDDEAVGPLLDLSRQWAPRGLEMRWIGGEILLNLLATATPVSVPQVDQRWWQLRLQLLRLINRATVFDEVAIDYCVTYEISPPSWEASACRVRVSGPVGARTTIIGEASTSFVESEFADEPGLVQMVSLELAGQMVGDVDAVLRKLDSEIGEAKLIELSCIKLLRVDFMASGELLNWVLGHNRSQRIVRFVDTNRLVARFFSAIGIDAYATVKVRTV